MIRTAQDIKQLGTILGVWAHPDDETWSSAGIMATARANGQEVYILSATAGDAGETADEAKWAKTSLRDIRCQELIEALAAVDVTQFTLLDYPDGQLGTVNEEKIIEEIKTHIEKVRPDTILTFEPEGITGHIDHKQISKWAQASANDSSLSPSVYGAVETVESYNSIGKRAHELFNVYFATEQPALFDEDELAICFELTDSIRDKKRTAMKAHASQTHQLFEHEVGRKLLEQALTKECFIRLS